MNTLRIAVVGLLLGTAPAFADVTEVWTAKCKSCHGESGKADTAQGKKHKIEDMSTADWQAGHTDGEIKKAITDGVADTKMKAYGDKLSAAEIDGLVKHVRALKK
ncbi:MAG: c-type cytochrome [Myxococcaceae bacterium]